MDDRMLRLEQIASQHAQMHLDNQMRMRAFEEKLDQNTKDTQEIKKGVGSMIDTMSAWSGAMKVIGWIAKPATAGLALVGGAVGLYFLLFPRK
jgi:hypothetical protein